jgi:hypothetical protein
VQSMHGRPRRGGSCHRMEPPARKLGARQP